MAGSTNFQQWNPGKFNQKDDASYGTDSQRSGGAAVGSPFPSNTANKLFYQTSTGVAALMQMMATKGYNVSDASFSALASVLSAIQTTADQRGQLQVVTWSSTITCDASKFNGFQCQLLGNTTIAVTGATAGQILTFILQQDATGSRTVTWPAGFGGNYGGGGRFQPDPTGTVHSIITFEIASDLTGKLVAGPINGLGLGGVPIGATNPQSGAFTTLSANAAASFQSVNCTSLSSSGGISGNTLTSNGETVNGNVTVNGNETVNGQIFCQYVQSQGNFRVVGTSQFDGNVNMSATLAVNNETVSTLAIGNGTVASVPLQTDNSAALVNTQWAKVGLATNLVDGTATANGTFVFPTWMGGLKLCWGTATNSSGSSPTSVNINFPTSFFTNVFIILPVGIPPTRTTVYVTSLTNGGATIETAGSTVAAYFLAVGV